MKISDNAAIPVDDSDLCGQADFLIKNLLTQVACIKATLKDLGNVHKKSKKMFSY